MRGEVPQRDGVVLVDAEAGYYGTYHKMNFKHPRRYVAEFATRHNVGDLDTINQMAAQRRAREGNGSDIAS